MNVFELSALLSLDKSKYEEGLTSASEEGKSFGSKLGSALGTAGKVAGVAVAAVGTAVAAVGTAMANGIKETAAYGDEIDKMSQKIGISAEAYQEWDFIAQHSGTSMSAVQSSMKKLVSSVESGSDAFEKIGLSMEDVQKMSQEDLFDAVISGLQGMEEGTERASIAQKLLGRGAQELAPLLNTSAEETQAMKDQLHELGGVMSDEAVKNSAGFQDSLQNLQTAISGLKNGAMSDFLPSVTSIFDGLTAIFGGDNDSGVAKITQGVQDIAKKITDSLPQLMDTGLQIIEGIAKAIMDNLPSLVKTGTDIVMKLAQTLIDNLPEIMAIGLDMIITLVEGIAESLPELIPAAIDAILTIVDGLLDNIDKIVDAGIDLMIGLVEGIVKALPKIVAKMPEIIIKIVKALSEAAPKLFEAALTMINTLWQGLKDNLPVLIEKIPEIIDNVKESLKEGWTKIKDIGSEWIVGLWEGINDKVQWIKDKIAGFVGDVKSWLKKFFGGGGDESSEGSEGTSGSYSIRSSSIRNIVEDAVSVDVKKSNKELVDAINELGANMYSNMVDAIADGLTWEWDDRQLGRMVKNYA